MYSIIWLYVIYWDCGSQCYEKRSQWRTNTLWQISRDWIIQGGSLYQDRKMNCSQPSLLLFIHLGRPRSLFTFHFHCFVLPSPPLSHVPPLKIIPPSFTVPSSLYTLSSLPPPSYYPLVTCSSPPPPPSVLPSIFHLFSTLSFLSSHFEQNRFSIMFWVPGSFYISQPDPNTAGVTPHAPETLTHTHTHIYPLTHIWYTSASTYNLMEWRRGRRMSSVRVNNAEVHSLVRR